MTSPSSPGPAGNRPVVYLHVGEPKSGTTFVQQIMWANREALSKHGVLLPGDDFWDHFRANQDLREAAQQADDPTGSWAGEWETLVGEALQAERAAVISHELLAMATAEQAARALESLAAAEVHIVFSVRDFATLLPAEWQERVKHRDPKSWEEWLDVVMSGSVDSKPGAARAFWRVHDTADLLRRWTQGIPPHRVHVVTMPPPGAPPALLWERFASVLGVDAGSVDLAAARPNASLGFAEVETLRRLNAALRRPEIGSWFYAVNVKERLAHGYLASRPAKLKPALTPEQQKWAQERCQIAVDTLRAAGVDIVGDLDDLLPRTVMTTEDPGRVHTDSVPTRAMLDAAIGALAAVLRNQFDPPPATPQEQRLLKQRASARAEAAGPDRLRRGYAALGGVARTLRGGPRVSAATDQRAPR